MNPQLLHIFSLAPYSSSGAGQLCVQIIRKKVVVSVSHVGGPDCITMTFKLKKSC